jgi:hypothetical protein
MTPLVKKMMLRKRNQLAVNFDRTAWAWSRTAASCVWHVTVQ